MREIDELFEKKKEAESALHKVEAQIARFQRDCKHPNAGPSQGPEPSLIDTYCPDCRKLW